MLFLSDFNEKPLLLTYLKGLSVDDQLQWFQENFTPKNHHFSGEQLDEATEETKQNLSSVVMELFLASYDNKLRLITNNDQLHESFKKMYVKSEMV